MTREVVRKLSTMTIKHRFLPFAAPVPRLFRLIRPLIRFRATGCVYAAARMLKAFKVASHAQT